MMTRCIHCTRCVRFLTEVSAIFDLGVLGRGFFMEIGTFLENHFVEELSGNIIDLCPVGALTSMPYAFTARPWELTYVESIDILDSLAVAVRLDVVNNKVVRIVPVLDEFVNGEWITNKARFVYDSFNTQRSLYPRVRLYSKLLVVGWSVAFNVFFRSFFRNVYYFFKALIGGFLDLEGCLALKVFLNSFGCSNINYQFNNFQFSDFSFSFSLSTPLVEFELLDFCFFIGSNLRTEAPLLNYRLRKSFLASAGNFLCFSFGLSLDSISFPVYSLGNSFFSLKLFSEGRSSFFSNFLLRGRTLSFKFFNFNYGFFRNSCFLVGSSLLFHRFDLSAIFEIFGFLSVNSFIHAVFNLHVISGFLGRISAFDLGLVGEVFQMQLDVSSFSFDAFVYFLGTDEVSLAFPWSSKSFLVYQGNFYSNSVFFNFLNLLFPVSLYTERVGSFLNIQGLLRVTKKVIDSPVAYTDWELLKALFIFRMRFFGFSFSLLGCDFSFVGGFFLCLIDYSCMFFYNFAFSSVLFTNICVLPMFEKLFMGFCKFRFSNSIFSRAFNNYYSSDLFSRNSKLLSLCSTKLAIDNFSMYI